MKHWLVVAALVCFGSNASASPYFRLIDLNHPQPVLGALVAPEELGNTEATSLLPLITHSTKDGCFLPSLVCSDWSPLSIGASMNAGQLTFVAAPVGNVLPWIQRAALMATPSSWQNVINVLAPSKDQSVTFSAGPAWMFKQSTNKGYFRIFTGLALHF